MVQSHEEFEKWPQDYQDIYMYFHKGSLGLWQANVPTNILKVIEQFKQDLAAEIEKTIASSSTG